MPYERKFESIQSSMSKQKSFQINGHELKHELHSLENLSKLSSFATLNSSMLFMPKSTTNSSYISRETVLTVMQQQLLKKESLTDASLSSISSFPIHTQQRYHQKQKFDDTLSSGDSSVSSQRDSGLSSGINDGSINNSPRDSLAENEANEIDSLIKQTKQLMSKLKSISMINSRIQSQYLFLFSLMTLNSIL